MRELELNEMDGISGAGSKIKKKCVKWESSAMHRCSKWKMIFSPWRLATFSQEVGRESDCGPNNVRCGGMGGGRLPRQYDPAGGRRNP